MSGEEIDDVRIGAAKAIRADKKEESDLGRSRGRDCASHLLV